MSQGPTDGPILEARYRDALTAYVDADRDEESQRVAAFELGRAAVAQEYGLLELLTLHHASVSSLLEQLTGADDIQRRLAKANEFLTQVTAPFEMAYRGWHGLADRLRMANEELENRVAERTAAHRLAEERLHRAQHIAGIGSWELDRQAGRQIWSEELYRICGLPEDLREPASNDIAAFVHEDDRQRYDNWFARLEAGRDPGSLEYRIRRPNGEHRVLLAEGEATSAGDAVTKVSCTMQDITERKAGEARLNELQAELVHVSRLSELGQMVSALAHEVNQPLTAQANYLSAARRLLAAGNQQGAQQALERIAQQAGRAQQIIQRLREFVRKGETQRRVESLARTIEEASTLALIGAGQGVKLDIKVADDAAEAVIDKVQIQQVLLNLIRNAVEAMAGSARRELSISTVRAGNRVQIQVADTGPGLPQQVRARLFQPFVTTKPTGMGVGLWVCRAIAEAHGGELLAEDAVGGGTAFRLTVPRPDGSDEGEPRPGE